jgi:voltage-gated potassium channel
MPSLRRKLFLHFDLESWPKGGLSLVNKIIAVLVLISVVSAVLETETAIAEQFSTVFAFGNVIFLYAFTIEYLIRVWVAGERPEYSGFTGRIRFGRSFFAIIDLAAIAPFWLGFGSEFLVVRIIRILRILKLLKIPGVSEALSGILLALSKRKIELLLSAGAAAFLMLIAASFLYFAERLEQPEAFGSIPRALWWGVATLTTVGYGDVYPVTALGRVFAGIFAFSGIGLIAMPAGIMAAALNDVFQDSKRPK